MTTNSPEPPRIAEEVRQKLCGVVNGYFHNVAQILDEIRNRVLSSEMSEDEFIQKISSNSLKHKTEFIMEVLDDLNQTLTAQEVEQLNFILAWIVYGATSVSVNELAAAWFLHTGKPFLQDIETQIRRKYSNILQIEGRRAEDQFVIAKLEYLREYFNRSKHERRLRSNAQEDDQPRISMTVTLDHVSVPQTKRFFRNLGEKDAFDESVFATAATTSQSNSRISANKVDANLLVVKTCFKLLLDEDREETSALDTYATDYLFTHLEELLKERNRTETSERAEVVADLIDLLQEPTSLESHLHEGLLDHGGWLHHELTITQKWLSDSEATRELDRKNLEWLKEAPASDILFPMREMAFVIAGQWLCDRRLAPQSPYHWIHVFLLREEKAQSRNKNAVLEGSEGNQGSANESIQGEYTLADARHEAETASARINRCAQWAVVAAGLDEDSLFNERLGRTYLFYGKTDLAIERLREAKKLPNSSWQLSQCLADTYAQNDEIKMALVEIEASFGLRRGDHEITSSGKVEFINDLIKAAGWNMRLCNTSDAVTQLKEAIRLDEHYYTSYHELFRLLNDTGQGLEAMSVLVDMDTAPAAQHEGLTKLDSMLFEHRKWIGETQALEKVFQATKSHEAFGTILSALRNALEFAENEDMNTHKVDLHLGYGLALASADRFRGNAHSALDEWDKCLLNGIGSEEFTMRRMAIRAATLIFNYHFSQALAAREISTTNTDEYTISVQEMEDITARACHDESGERPLKGSLASFYAREGNQEKGRQLLTSDIRDGLDHLYDRSAYAAMCGYEKIANCLMHAGDHLDALSAWCVHGTRYISQSVSPKIPNQSPTGHKKGDGTIADTVAVVPANDTSKASERLLFFCDGPCGKWFTYNDRFWFCTVCNETCFCDDCLAQVQTGTLHTRVCAADHEWLCVPSFLAELKATGLDRVRAGGVVKDGRRVGGGVVSVEEWLDTVKRRWKIPLTKTGEGGGEHE